MKHEDKIDKEKELFQESASNQFWKYLKNNKVIDIFLPALTILYEMPIKPTNLLEFFAEYLEHGAADLLKISSLQVELCYKRAEVYICALNTQLYINLIYIF